MTTRYYRKANTLKEELMARFCTVMNFITRSKDYGLLKGWSIVQIVSARKYKELLKEKGAKVLKDGVIEIVEG